MENSNGVGREPPGNSNNNNRKPKDQKGQSRGSGKLRRQAVGTMNRNAKESGGTERGLAKHHHPNNNRPFVTQTRTRKVSIGPDTGRKMRRDDPRTTEATGNSTGDSTAASATNADVCRICKESTHMMTMEQKDKQICFRCVYRTCACCGKENGIATTLMIKKRICPDCEEQMQLSAASRTDDAQRNIMEYGNRNRAYYDNYLERARWTANGIRNLVVKEKAALKPTRFPCSDCKRVDVYAKGMSCGHCDVVALNNQANQPWNKMANPYTRRNGSMKASRTGGQSKASFVAKGNWDHLESQRLIGRAGKENDISTNAKSAQDDGNGILDDEATDESNKKDVDPAREDRIVKNKKRVEKAVRAKSEAKMPTWKSLSNITCRACCEPVRNDGELCDLCKQCLRRDYPNVKVARSDAAVLVGELANDKSFCVCCWNRWVSEEETICGGCGTQYYCETYVYQSQIESRPSHKPGPVADPNNAKEPNEDAFWLCQNCKRHWVYDRSYECVECVELEKAILREDEWSEGSVDVGISYRCSRCSNEVGQAFLVPRSEFTKEDVCFDCKKLPGPRTEQDGKKPDQPNDKGYYLCENCEDFWVGRQHKTCRPCREGEARHECNVCTQMFRWERLAYCYHGGKEGTIKVCKDCRLWPEDPIGRKTLKEGLKDERNSQNLWPCRNCKSYWTAGRYHPCQTCVNRSILQFGASYIMPNKSEEHTDRRVDIFMELYEMWIAELKEETEEDLNKHRPYHDDEGADFMEALKEVDRWDRKGWHPSLDEFKERVRIKLNNTKAIEKFDKATGFSDRITTEPDPDAEELKAAYRNERGVYPDGLMYPCSRCKDKVCIVEGEVCHICRTRMVIRFTYSDLNDDEGFWEDIYPLKHFYIEGKKGDRTKFWGKSGPCAWCGDEKCNYYQDVVAYMCRQCRKKNRKGFVAYLAPPRQPTRRNAPNEDDSNGSSGSNESSSDGGEEESNAGDDSNGSNESSSDGEDESKAGDANHRHKKCEGGYNREDNGDDNESGDEESSNEESGDEESGDEEGSDEKGGDEEGGDEEGGYINGNDGDAEGDDEKSDCNELRDGLASGEDEEGSDEEDDIPERITKEQAEAEMKEFKRVQRAKSSKQTNDEPEIVEVKQGRLWRGDLHMHSVEGIDAKNDDNKNVDDESGGREVMAGANRGSDDGDNAEGDDGDSGNDYGMLDDEAFESIEIPDRQNNERSPESQWRCNRFPPSEWPGSPEELRKMEEQCDFIDFIIPEHDGETVDGNVATWYEMKEEERLQRVIKERKEKEEKEEKRILATASSNGQWLDDISFEDNPIPRNRKEALEDLSPDLPALPPEEAEKVLRVYREMHERRLGHKSPGFPDLPPEECKNILRVYWEMHAKSLRNKSPGLVTQDGTKANDFDEDKKSDEEADSYEEDTTPEAIALTTGQDTVSTMTHEPRRSGQGVRDSLENHPLWRNRPKSWYIEFTMDNYWDRNKQDDEEDTVMHEHRMIEHHKKLMKGPRTYPAMKTEDLRLYCYNQLSDECDCGNHGCPMADICICDSTQVRTFEWEKYNGQHLWPDGYKTYYGQHNAVQENYIAIGNDVNKCGVNANSWKRKWKSWTNKRPVLLENLDKEDWKKFCFYNQGNDGRRKKKYPRGRHMFLNFENEGMGDEKWEMYVESVISNKLNVHYLVINGCNLSDRGIQGLIRLLTDKDIELHRVECWVLPTSSAEWASDLHPNANYAEPETLNKLVEASRKHATLQTWDYDYYSANNRHAREEQQHNERERYGYPRNKIVSDALNKELQTQSPMPRQHDGWWWHMPWCRGRIMRKNHENFMRCADPNHEAKPSCQQKQERDNPFRQTNNIAGANTSQSANKTNEKGKDSDNSDKVKMRAAATETETKEPEKKRKRGRPRKQPEGSHPTKEKKTAKKRKKKQRQTRK